MKRITKRLNQVDLKFARRNLIKSPDWNNPHNNPIGE